MLGLGSGSYPIGGLFPLTRAKNALPTYLSPGRAQRSEMKIGSCFLLQGPTEGSVRWEAIYRHVPSAQVKSFVSETYVTRCRSSGPLGALLSSPALDVRLIK